MRKRQVACMNKVDKGEAMEGKCIACLIISEQAYMYIVHVRGPIWWYILESAVFLQIDHLRTIYFSALIGAQTNRGHGVIEGAVY